MKKQTKASEKQIIDEVIKEAVNEISKADEIIEKEKTVEAIAEDLKKEHREVYITNIAGLQIVWKKLSRSEYKELMSAEFNENEELRFLEKQDFIAEKVILYPANVKELIEEYAGISDLIATEAMVKSGFGLTSTRTV